MSFADKAKTKTPKRVTLEAWLESLPDKEREGAEHMLRSPELWPLAELLSDFRDEGAPKFGKDQYSAWRKAHDVVR